MSVLLINTARIPNDRRDEIEVFGGAVADLAGFSLDVRKRNNSEAGSPDITLRLTASHAKSIEDEAILRGAVEREAETLLGLGSPSIKITRLDKVR